jgi:hypothetical protein
VVRLLHALRVGDRPFGHRPCCRGITELAERVSQTVELISDRLVVFAVELLATVTARRMRVSVCSESPIC